MAKKVISVSGDLSDMTVCCTSMPGDRVRKLTEIAGSVRKTRASKKHAPIIHRYTRVSPSPGYV